jgi:hypothetical protein
MNRIPCANCAHFSQQYKYVAGKKKEVWYGHCKVRSVYPPKEWDKAEPFDLDVKRAPPGTTRSQLLVVERAGTRTECTSAIELVPEKTP